MLKLLHIENIAVIERCDIEFGRGFNVLTGETGAGKSIIIDALGTVLGERTSRGLVRTGENKAVVVAVFGDIRKECMAWLSENGLYDDGDELIIQREIYADGKSACRVNGRPITVAMLKELGTALLNIHGQHDDKLLLDTGSHADFIDKFSASDEFSGTYGEYRQVFSLLNEKKRELNALDLNEAEKERRISMLSFEINEIEQASIKPGEDSEIAEKRKMLQNQARVLDSLNYAYSLFSGDETNAGAKDAISEAANSLSGITFAAESIQKLYERVKELGYICSDITEEIRSLLETSEFSPQEIDYIESRFDLIQRLKRKYGATAEEILEYLKKAKDELKSIELSDEKIRSLGAEIEELNKKAAFLAEKLYKLRVSAAKAFETRVSEELKQLDMEKVRFSVEVNRRESLDIRGADDIHFLISTNPGEPLKPLIKIASGGELSRIMLSVKNVLAGHDMVDTLIFDEIDSGISGRAAQRVAEKLYMLSGNKQIMCVTHLAQISSMADVHFKISKTEINGRTYTQVASLDEDGRVDELARITGGAKITETTLNNARELLLNARKFKIQCR